MDDLHGIRQRPTLDLVQTNFSQKDHFKIWTVYEVGMSYEHVKCERVLHDDRTYIVPNSKCFGVVLQSMVLTNCKQAPTPSVVGFVKQKLDADLDMQECRHADADLETKSLLVHRLRQLMQWDGLVLDRLRNSVIGDTEDGQDEKEQQGAAVQTISDHGQGDGGVLDALDNSVSAIRGTN